MINPAWGRVFDSQNIRYNAVIQVVGVLGSCWQVLSNMHKAVHEFLRQVFPKDHILQPHRHLP